MLSVDKDSMKEYIKSMNELLEAVYDVDICCPGLTPGNCIFYLNQIVTFIFYFIQKGIMYNEI
jgi:hypothetical protein